MMRSIPECMAAAVLFLAASAPMTHGEETKVPLEKLPSAVTHAVKKMFPKAELIEATQEAEGDDEVEYEVTVKEGGKKIDITVEADGNIEALEKELALTDLPKAVTEAIEKAYPKGIHKSAEAVYEVEDGKEELEFYEVQLKTADAKDVEIKVEENGTVVAGPKDEKEADGK